MQTLNIQSNLLHLASFQVRRERKCISGQQFEVSFHLYLWIGKLKLTAKRFIQNYMDNKGSLGLQIQFQTNYQYTDKIKPN